MNKEQRRLHQEITQLQVDTAQLTAQIQQVKDPAYLERLGRDRYDLVAADELIFVFDDSQP